MHEHMQNMQYTCTADEISTTELSCAVFEKLNFNVNKFFTLVLVLCSLKPSPLPAPVHTIQTSFQIYISWSKVEIKTIRGPSQHHEEQVKCHNCNQEAFPFVLPPVWRSHLMMKMARD